MKGIVARSPVYDRNRGEKRVWLEVQAARGWRIGIQFETRMGLRLSRQSQVSETIELVTCQRRFRAQFMAANLLILPALDWDDAGADLKTANQILTR